MKNKALNLAILKHDQQVPRYTSYPTAPHFNDAVNAEIYTKHLKALSKKETLSLYFHIPYCQQLCWYCGCYTKITQRYAPVEDYVHLLTREIKIIGNLLQKKHQVTHIHFGGGSPTILLASTFEILMRAIKSEFNIAKDAEIAIEVDPRTVNEEKIITYAKSGVNRVSIGVQDFNLEVQEAINRIQSFDLVYETIKNFRKYNINDINLDLIYGLPKQTVEMVKKNIDYSLLLKPSRIALFSYAHVQWMKKHMRLIDEKDLPNAANKIAMYQVAALKLKEAGFEAIGLDHFSAKNDSMMCASKKKKLKRNFQGYSTDSASNILGFGVSSIGYLKSLYAQNTLDFEEYKKNILSEKLPTKKGIILSEEDAMRKLIIDEIMCYMEVDLARFSKKFNLPQKYFDNEIKKIKKLQKDKLVKIVEEKVIINPQAPQITRLVASFFDKFLALNNQKHSKIA